MLAIFTFIFVVYLFIAFVTSLIINVNFTGHHPLVGIWWPILLLKEIVKSFIQEVFR